MSVTISQNGFAKIKIVVNTSNRTLLFAASELAKYLFRISKGGFEIEQSSRTGKGLISLSAGTNESHDAFSIEAFDEFIRIHGENPRAVLFAVYELLEKIGCRFSEPFSEYVPNLATIYLDNFSVSASPTFDERSVYNTFNMFLKEYCFDGFEPARVVPQIDFLAKRKFSTFVNSVDFNRCDLWKKHRTLILDAILNRGLKAAIINETVKYFFPQSESADFGEYGDSTYEVTHPEFFRDGKLNPLLPEVRQIITERYISYLKAYPELDYVTLSPGLKTISPEEQEGYELLFSETGKAFAKEFPGKLFSIFFGENMGKTLSHFPENAFLIFEPLSENNDYPVTAQENASTAELLKKNAETAGWRKAVSVTRLDSTRLFAPVGVKMKKDVQYLSGLEYKGALFGTGRCYNILATGNARSLDTYLFSELLWNPDADLERLTKFWAQGIMPEAAEDLSEIYLTIASKHEDACKNGLIPQGSYLDLEFLHELQSIIGKTCEKKLSPAVNEKLFLLENNLAREVCYAKNIARLPVQDEFLK